MNSRFWLLVVVAALLTSGAAFGSGFSIFEQGAKATAMGGAFAATADDLSAIFYNVAGIAQLRHAEFLAGGTTINFSNEFNGDPNDPFTSGQRGEYRAHTFIPPNAYFVAPIGSYLTFGIVVMTPFGLRTNWREPWAGRFISRVATLRSVDVAPAVARQTADGAALLGFCAASRRQNIELNRHASPSKA